MNDPRGHRFLPYHPDAYDEHFALRIPPALWALMIYAVHAEALLLLGHLPQGGAELAFLLDYVRVGDLLASLPAVAVVIAALRRRPEAGRVLRALWSVGAWLLSASLLADVVLAASGPRAAWPAPRIALDLFCVCVLLGTARLRDTFADFPRPPL